MRAVSQNANEQSTIWEALPAENRVRVSRILARALTAVVVVPAGPDDDKSDAGGEPD